MSNCTHPPERHFAWFAYDAVTQSDILCLGCTACGTILSGAANTSGNATTPVHVHGAKSARSTINKKGKR